MSVLTRFRYNLARLISKAATLNIVPPWFDRSILTPTFRSLTREAYYKNAAFLACVSALNFGISEAPLVVLDDDEQLLRKHPLASLLRRPNPLMSGTELKVITMAYMAIGGNAYWHKIKSRSGVLETWPYHAGQIFPVPGGNNWIDHYDFDDGTGVMKPVAADEIVHFKWPTPDPEQPWQAIAPLRAAASEVDADNEASRYLRALLQNDAIPRTIITQSPERYMNDDEVRRARTQYSERYGGDNRGGVLILEGGATVSRLGLDLQEMAFEAMHNIPEARIAAVMRVPPIIAGLNVGLNRSTFSNYAEARTAFTQDTIVPFWNIIASEIESDRDLNRNDLIVRHDLSRVAALQEDQNRKWARVTAAYREGLLDDDEARAELGKPPYSATQRAAMVVSGPAAPAAQPTQPAALPEPQPTKALPAPLDRKASLKRSARALQRVRLDVATRMESAIDQYFADLAARVIARATKAWKPAALEAKALPAAELLLTVGDMTVLEDVVGSYYIDLIKLSWETWNSMLGVEVVFGMDDPAVVAALADAGQRVSAINETTLGALRGLLQYGAEQGWTIDQLVDGVDGMQGLRNLVTESYKGRARTIARTELGTAQNSASLKRYEATGVNAVTVMDGGGPNSCQACNDIDGTTQTTAWASMNALEHPNCVRAFAPAYDD